jgi:hypothetical protein
MKSIIFWDVTPCNLLSCKRRFGGTYGLHLQGRRNNFSKNQQAFCLPPAYVLVLPKIIYSTLKMEAICFSERSVATQKITRRHIPEDNTLQDKQYSVGTWTEWNICRIRFRRVVALYIRSQKDLWTRYWQTDILNTGTSHVDFKHLNDYPRYHLRNSQGINPLDLSDGHVKQLDVALSSQQQPKSLFYFIFLIRWK